MCQVILTIIGCIIATVGIIFALIINPWWITLVIVGVVLFVLGTAPYTTTTTTTKGIVFFDIDGTLTTAVDADEVVQAALDEGYMVGVITASDRTIQETCAVSKVLCDYMTATNFRTFNTFSVTAGEEQDWDPTIRAEAPELQHGMRKALQMKHAKTIFPDQQRIVLFDDDACFITGAKKYFPEGVFVCAGNDCHGVCHTNLCCKENKDIGGRLRLSKDLVKQSLRNI